MNFIFDFLLHLLDLNPVLIFLYRLFLNFLYFQEFSVDLIVLSLLLCHLYSEVELPGCHLVQRVLRLPVSRELERF